MSGLIYFYFDKSQENERILGFQDGCYCLASKKPEKNIKSGAKSDVSWVVLRCDGMCAHTLTTGVNHNVFLICMFTFSVPYGDPLNMCTNVKQCRHFSFTSQSCERLLF